MSRLLSGVVAFGSYVSPIITYSFGPKHLSVYTMAPVLNTSHNFPQFVLQNMELADEIEFRISTDSKRETRNPERIGIYN